MEKLMLLSFVFLLGFFKNQQGNTSIQPPTAAPPGTVKVSHNFYMDKMEMSNIDCREYLYWLQRVFGQDSEELKNATPSADVWKQAGVKNAEFLAKQYLSEEQFNFFPVVGFSWEQANAYLAWRNDRVYEMVLIKAGKLEPNGGQTADHYFTIEGYLNGTYTGKLPNYKPPKPAYRLPTIEEWEKVTAFEDSPYGSKKNLEKISALMKKGNYLFNTKELYLSLFNDQDSTTAPTAPVCFSKPNHLGICNLIGNVAEMVQEKGMAKGGSWAHALKDCEIKDNMSYSAPQPWLGFRAVCEWVAVE